MRVALSADMEGISQIEDPREILAFERSYWATGRERMTADVVAAAKGLLAGGADEVVVLDNHGSGNPVNLLVDRFPARVRLETWNIFDLVEMGVDAQFQVGYHAHAGVPSFVSHTYVPGLRLRVDGVPISESHGRTWGAGVPLLGIVGNDAHARSLGRLAGVPYLTVLRTNSQTQCEPALDDPLAAIEEFAAQAVRDGGVSSPPPRDFLFEASLPADEAADPQLLAAGWRRRSDTELEAELGGWSETRNLISAAMGAAFRPWTPAFTTYDLTSLEALEPVHDAPALREGRELFDAWLASPGPDWLGSA